MDNYSVIDTVWILISTILVFMMQAGFMMLETGLTRKKNLANVAIKNLMDFACGGIAFLVLGFGLLYETGNAFIGKIDFFASNAGDCTSRFPGSAYVIFTMMFCATAATIVSGAVVGRIKFKAYLIYTVLISAVIYPIAGHWVWGNGWLSNLTISGWTGFSDFAGGCVVHMVGGISALVAAIFVGPRIGKYHDGNSRVIAGHDIKAAVLGTFLLWIGWFGFNAGSVLSIENNMELAADIFLNTNVSAIFAAVAAMIFTWIRFNKPDVTMTLSGTLGGLVAITAGCNEVSVVSAAVIGVIAGILTVVMIEFVDNRLKIDDPVGAFVVHGVCGAFGTLAVGLFAKDGGLFTTGNFARLLIQLIGVAAVAVWTGLATFAVLLLVKHTTGIRVSPDEEIKGLDWSEHGIPYDNNDLSSINDYIPRIEEPADIQEAVPVIDFSEKTVDNAEVSITKLEIITRPEKFSVLKEELSKIGVSGMTVTNVMGCGIQKGTTEFYRGISSEINLRPKIQINIVITKVPVEKVVETVRKVLYIGHIGDGKIFIYDVKNVIKVRTDERGYSALQGADD